MGHFQARFRGKEGQTTWNQPPVSHLDPNSRHFVKKIAVNTAFGHLQVTAFRYFVDTVCAIYGDV